MTASWPLSCWALRPISIPLGPSPRWRSIRVMSGLWIFIAASAELPSPAVPTSSKSSIDGIGEARSSLKSGSSSKMKILIGIPGLQLPLIVEGPVLLGPSPKLLVQGHFAIATRPVSRLLAYRHRNSHFRTRQHNRFVTKSTIGTNTRQAAVSERINLIWRSGSRHAAA